MKFLKKFNSFVNESKTFTSGLYPHFKTDDIIYIEKVHENGDVEAFELSATLDNIVEWFVDKHGRDTFEDQFNPEDGHTTKDWDMSNVEIEELVKNNDQYLKEFCEDKVAEWIKISE